MKKKNVWLVICFVIPLCATTLLLPSSGCACMGIYQPKSPLERIEEAIWKELNDLADAFDALQIS